MKGEVDEVYTCNIGRRDRKDGDQKSSPSEKGSGEGASAAYFIKKNNEQTSKQRGTQVSASNCQAYCESKHCCTCNMGRGTE